MIPSLCLQAIVTMGMRFTRCHSRVLLWAQSTGVWETSKRFFLGKQVSISHVRPPHGNNCHRQLQSQHASLGTKHSNENTNNLINVFSSLRSASSVRKLECCDNTSGCQQCRPRNPVTACWQRLKVMMKKLH